MKVSRFQQKIIHHFENQEDLKSNEKRQRMPSNINVFPLTITNTSETNESTESLSKEIKDLKKSQMEDLELRSTITKIKSLVDGLTAEWTGQKK